MPDINTGPVTPVEIVVWWMDVGSPSPDTAQRWYLCLDPPERLRADRFRFQEDRLTYIAAHWLLREALSAVGDRPAPDWRFMAGQRGKPHIDPAAGPPDLAFSLSHTRGFVTCAVGLGVEIGIDVEALIPERASLDVARRFFSPSEIMMLHRAAPEEQVSLFFRLWTLKEAFVKATGEGISFALESVSFSLDPVSVELASDRRDEVLRWRFAEVSPTIGHVISVAIRCPIAAPANLTICHVVPSTFSPVRNHSHQKDIVNTRGTLTQPPKPPSALIRLGKFRMCGGHLLRET